MNKGVIECSKFVSIFDRGRYLKFDGKIALY